MRENTKTNRFTAPIPIKIVFLFLSLKQEVGLVVAALAEAE